MLAQLATLVLLGGALVACGSAPDGDPQAAPSGIDTSASPDTADPLRVSSLIGLWAVRADGEPATTVLRLGPR